MYYLYVILLIAIVFYILKTKKRSLYTVSILSSIIYFLPNFFGYTSIVYSKVRITEPITPVLYLIHLMFVFVMLVFHLFIERTNNKKKHRFALVLNEKLLSKTLFTLSILLFLGSLIILKGNIIIDKTKLPRGWFSVYSMFANLTLVFSILNNYINLNYKKVVLQSVLLFIIFLQGHRSYLIFVLIGIFINEYVIEKKNILKISNIVFIFIVAIFGFMGKTIVVLSRQGVSFFLIMKQILNINNIIESISNSEPFITQHILNMTILTEFTLEFSYIKRFFLKLFFLSPDKVTSTPHFYERFTTRFYPDINYGIAYNIFSEPYAIGKLWGVLLFIIIYALMLKWLNKLISSEDRILSSMGLILSSIYAFYIFRNSIENIILWTQVILIIFFICYCFQIFIEGKIKRKL